MNQRKQKQTPEELTYQYFEVNRYKITEYSNVQALCNNGFIKLYTLNTRVYWHAQNEFQHRVPDWKFHISVQHNDLKKAWNLLVSLFLKLKCRAGMKVVYLKEANSPQVGRQITLYMVKIDKKFNSSSFANEFNVSLADEHSEDFWLNFVLQIESLLSQNLIRSNGLAHGDLALGKYVSLRNEAFVQGDDGNYIYPPNNKGWNPLNQTIPININKFRQALGKKTQKSVPIFYLSLPLLLITLGLWFSQR